MMTGRMNAAGTIADSFLTLFANSSGFLLFGLFAAGLVHALAHRFETLQRSVPRGLKAIALGIVAGMPLPICSCGLIPLAIALRRRHAHPETVASFVVSTPETSLDAVGLTAALLGLPFALLRVLAGLTAALLAGIFVIAIEAWPPRKEREHDGDIASGDLHEHDAGAHSQPEWWHRLVAWARRTWTEWFGHERKPPVGEAPTEISAPPPGRARVRRTLIEAARIGFIETLDEIAWTLLLGFALSAVVLAFLPNDFAARIPGGLLGQTLFGLALSLPLYVCASGSIPLAAALLAKGLSPVAVLAIFLIGPLTNPAMLLVLSRSFGRRFVAALIIAGLIAAIVFGGIMAIVAKTPAVQAAQETQLAGAVGGWDIFFSIIFVPLFALSLARAGVRRAASDIRLAFASIVPAEARRAIGSLARRIWTRRARVGWIGAGVAAGAWILSGCAVIPEGRVGFAEVFGKADQRPVQPGLRWTLPRPFGRVTVVDSGAVIDVSVGFRPDAAEEGAWSDPSLLTPAADSGWHAAYTSSGSRPEESTYVTGDLNLVESKAGIHLLISDARTFAYQGGDPIETVRSLYQASLRELLAQRPIDDTLTAARSWIEQAARRDLQRRLTAAHIPLQALSVNLLDLHPPDASVRAFRDISSALEDRETRIHQARGKAGAALPAARGEAAMLFANAQADRGENVARASGVSIAFAVQADVARKSGTAVRSMLRWDALDHLLIGKRIVLFPHGTARDLVDTPPAGGFF
jgi:uncharacterized membrane protein YraQ (UPF0718 family)/regulator of protease activity HflC (stomatin/prohibitin superfamily)